MYRLTSLGQVYFGFTHCPDICPDELDKMAKMLDLVRGKKGNVLQAVFVSADPARDTPEVVKHYLAEFHPDFIGLTGTYDNVKDMCKTYRVYFSTPSNVKPGQDYLVDHSIYFYLMGQYIAWVFSALRIRIADSYRPRWRFRAGARTTTLSGGWCQDHSGLHQRLEGQTQQGLSALLIRRSGHLQSLPAAVYQM